MRKHRRMTAAMVPLLMVAVVNGLSCGDSGNGGYKPKQCPAQPSCSASECLDCAWLTTHLTASVSAGECKKCQGALCNTNGSPPAGCHSFPCSAGKVVIRACDCDADCKGIAPFCGQYASRHGICQLTDPI